MTNNVGHDRVSWKTFWSVFGCAATLGVGATPVLFDLPHVGWVPLAGVIAGIVLVGVIACLAAGPMVHQTSPFRGLPGSRRQHIVSLIRLAVACHIGWAVTFQLRPEWWGWWPLVLLGLSGAEYAYCAGHEWYLKLPPKPAPEPGPQQQAPQEPDKPIRQMRAALQLADLAPVQVLNWKSNVDEDGASFGVDFEARVPPKGAQRGA